jgi:hypothetical protein
MVRLCATNLVYLSFSSREAALGVVFSENQQILPQARIIASVYSVMLDKCDCKVETGRLRDFLDNFQTCINFKRSHNATGKNIPKD